MADDDRDPHSIIGSFISGAPKAGELSAADIKDSLFLSDESIERSQLESPELYAGAAGRAQLEYETLHYRAIRLLRDAEDFSCPVRVSVLFDIAETLDRNVLPADFFQRLVYLKARIRKVGRKRPRTSERDRNIRRDWVTLRGEQSVVRQWMAGKMPSYTETLILLAEKYGRSEKAIEAIISAGDQTKERGDWKRDYERLEAAIYKRFPKK